MAQDIFLKLDGIQGESHDVAHKNEIEVNSWSWGASQHSNMHLGTGGGAGKATVKNFCFSHYIDKASINLMKYCLAGKHIPKAHFTIRKAGGSPLEYVKMVFEDVLITDVSMDGSHVDEARPSENVQFTFASVTADYIEQNDKGGQAGAVSLTYNIKGNDLS